jgi:hypothetical protein
MWIKILKMFGIITIKPDPMMITENDLFVLLEVNATGANLNEPKTLNEQSKDIIAKYGEQPLKYFNEYKRLKLIHLKTGTVKDVNLKIEI